jgi:general secretion pathway protein G
MKTPVLIAIVLLGWLNTAFAWSSKASKTSNEIHHASVAIECYHWEHDRLPSVENCWVELALLRMWDTEPGGAPLDAWKRPVHYRVPGRHGEFDLYSYGADGIDNDGQFDDISNWAGVNEGYYWKSHWPGGRSMIRWGKIIGIGCLLLGFFFPMRLVLPFSWGIIAFGSMVGNQMLLHPGIVPDYNSPLIAQARSAGLVLILLLAVFIFNFRRYILRKHKERYGAPAEAHAHP